LVIWDGLEPHRCGVGFYSASARADRVEFLSGYARDSIQSILRGPRSKQRELLNFCPAAFRQLRDHVRRALCRMRRPTLVRAFWQQTKCDMLYNVNEQEHAACPDILAPRMKYDLCVIGGAGHVGFPLSVGFAGKGKRVVIYDINKSAIETIARAEMPFMEPGCETLLGSTINKTLFTSCDIATIGEAKFIIVIIGTPVDEHLNPVWDQLNTFFDSIMPYLRGDQIVILRSTVYPGTTSRLRRDLRRKIPGIEVCFACERILEGKAMEELYSLPQIIAGEDDDAIAQVAALFRELTSEIIVTGCIEAELAKLFTNSWRYIQFATANQFYMIAEQYGADFYEIFRAMVFNYPRAKSFPRPGFAAGPCLFKDTMQLNAFSNNQFSLGHCAMLVNEGLPNFLLPMLKGKCNLSEMRVGILGMAFKAESDDRRESLSYKLRKILLFESKEVICSDEYIKDQRFVSAEELVTESDVIIIGAPHAAYKRLDYKGKIVVDVWDLTSQAESKGKA
jgi:UDP-N-acetyl-D-mannosaminuronic acid dehydrogenase